MRAVIRGILLVAILLLPLVLGLASLMVAWRGQLSVNVGQAVRILLVLSASIALLNGYLSFGRPILYATRHKNSLEGYKHVSGIPVVGTVLTALAIAFAWGSASVAMIGILLLLVDTGGSFVFLLVVARDKSFWTEA